MIGIDIVRIDRISRLVARHGDKALLRFLSHREIKLSGRNISTIAGFWSAKEAGAKAIGTGIGRVCGFKDIKLGKTNAGQPTIKYKKKLRKKFSINSSSLSISHDGGFAIAVVVYV